MIRYLIVNITVLAGLFFCSCNSEKSPAISHIYLTNPEKFSSLVEIRYGATRVTHKYLNSGKVVYILKGDERSSIVVLTNSIPKNVLSVTNGLKREVKVLKFEKVKVGGVLITRNGEKVDNFSNITDAVIGYTLSANNGKPDQYEIEYFDGSKDLVDVN